MENFFDRNDFLRQKTLKTMGMAGLMLLAFSSSLYAEDVSLLKPHAGTNVTQQASTLKGVVSDDFGPVAGASVVVKGTTNGVMTGMDGSFVLNGVKRGDVIVISYIGFATQEILTPDKQP